MSGRPSTRVLRRALRLPGVRAVARRAAAAWQGVLVLNYHRIGDGRGSPFDRGLWSATAEDFDRHLALLKRHCDVIGPADLAAAAGRGRGRYGLVTFDDGYRDNYESAFPILRSHGVTGTFFVATGFLDRPRLPWWDEIAWMVRSSDRRAVPAGRWLKGDVRFDEPGREGAVRTLLRAYKALPGHETREYVEWLAQVTGSGRFRGADPARLWMTWDMLREMRAAGMCVGGHTVSHPVLARLAPDEQRAEVAGCRRRIEAELGGPMRAFSYPVGGRQAFDAETRRCLKDESVELAFSYYGTFRRFGEWDPYDVPRVAVERDTTPRALADVLTMPQVFA